jgi:hypothetical protein
MTNQQLRAAVIIDMLAIEPTYNFEDKHSMDSVLLNRVLVAIFTVKTLGYDRWVKQTTFIDSFKEIVLKYSETISQPQFKPSII